MRKIDDEEVLRRFRVTHGNRYGYSRVDYQGTQETVLVYCEKHGWFEIQPHAHWNGQGCRKCGYESNKISIEEATVRDKKAHGNNFKYLEEFKRTDIPRLTRCEKCGYTFTQTPHDHWNGSSCRKCAYKLSSEKQRLTSEELNDKSSKIFGNNKFIYPDNYLNFMTEIDIKCNTCQTTFLCTLSNHFTSPTGCCPTCRVHGGFNPSEPGILYYIKDTVTGYYKPGITNGTVKSRYGHKLKDIEIIETWYFENGQDARDKEKALHEEYSEFRLLNENFVGFGATEFFNKDILNLDDN